MCLNVILQIGYTAVFFFLNGFPSTFKPNAGIVHYNMLQSFLSMSFLGLSLTVSLLIDSFIMRRVKLSNACWLQ